MNITEAVESALSGFIIQIKISENNEIKKELAFGLGYTEKACMRWCGSENRPNGTGSHSVIASWWDYCLEKDALVESIEHACECWAKSLELENFEINCEKLDK